MVKVFGNVGEVILNRHKQYTQEVTGGTFLITENYFGMKDEEYGELLKMVD